MPPRPKRHHYVPRAYLQRFGLDDTVLVRRRDSRIFETSTLNVAVESGFYDVPDASGGKSSRVEDTLAVVDGAAAEAMAVIDRLGVPPAEDTEERFTLTVFLALQMTRTTQHREQVMFPERVAEWAGERELTQALVTEYLALEHLGFAPSDREAAGAFLYVSQALKDGAASPEFAIRMMLWSVEALAPRLRAMNWTLETDRKEQLITSDVPIVIWRTPTPLDEYEGIGIDNAEELRFPLDPGKQLVLSRRKRTPSARMPSARARSCNADMASGCHRFVIGRPNRRSQVERARLDKRRPVIRFNTGPLIVTGPDGRKVREGEVLHVWVPRRAWRR